MANYEVVKAVSLTLQQVLSKELREIDANWDAVLSDLLDGNLPTGTKLTIFLFEVGEDPSARNRPRVRELQAPDLALKKPPMALLLRYLLTPWSGSPDTNQAMLARAMQVLYDRAILTSPELESVLSDSDDTLKITLAPLSLEERTRVWHAVQKPYHLSVSYEVRVVNLDSEDVTRVRPVARRTMDFGAQET